MSTTIRTQVWGVASQIDQNPGTLSPPELDKLARRHDWKVLISLMESLCDVIKIWIARVLDGPHGEVNGVLMRDFDVKGEMPDGTLLSHEQMPMPMRKDWIVDNLREVWIEHMEAAHRAMQWAYINLAVSTHLVRDERDPKQPVQGAWLHPLTQMNSVTRKHLKIPPRPTVDQPEDNDAALRAQSEQLSQSQAPAAKAPRLDATQVARFASKDIRLGTESAVSVAGTAQS